MPDHGIHLESCKFVEYGNFCNLEVFSKAAFANWVVTQPMPDHGIHLVICKFAEYGYFCNLEAFSKACGQACGPVGGRCGSSGGSERLEPTN